MAAKMMKRSRAIEKRQQQAIEKKKTLLKDIEEYDDLKIHCLKILSKSNSSISAFFIIL